MLQVRCARFDVSLRGDIVRFRRLYARARRFDIGALRIHVRRRLYAFEAQQDGALLDVIAFLHSNVSNLADALAQHIRVRQRLDFA